MLRLRWPQVRKKAIITRFFAFALAVVIGALAPNQATANHHCIETKNIFDPKNLETLSMPPMHSHVHFVTCIASALSAGDFDQASWIAEAKLGLHTRGGVRSDQFGYNEPSQEIWERGFEFRRQASRFAASAKAAHHNQSKENKSRAYEEFLSLLSRCQSCHEAVN